MDNIARLDELMEGNGMEEEEEEEEDYGIETDHCAPYHYDDNDDELLVDYCHYENMRDMDDASSFNLSRNLRLNLYHDRRINCIPRYQTTRGEIVYRPNSNDNHNQTPFMMEFFTHASHKYNCGWWNDKQPTVNNLAYHFKKAGTAANENIIGINLSLFVPSKICIGGGGREEQQQQMIIINFDYMWISDFDEEEDKSIWLYIDSNLAHHNQRMYTVNIQLNHNIDWIILDTERHPISYVKDIYRKSNVMVISTYRHPYRLLYSIQEEEEEEEEKEKKKAMGSSSSSSQRHYVEQSSIDAFKKHFAYVHLLNHEQQDNTNTYTVFHDWLRTPNGRGFRDRQEAMLTDPRYLSQSVQLQLTLETGKTCFLPTQQIDKETWRMWDHHR